MLNNRQRASASLAGGAFGGVLGFASTWLLERARVEEPAPLLWGGAWYGVGVGVGATVLYVVSGGRTPVGAAGAAALASTLVLLGLFTFLVVREVGEGELGDLVLGAVLVFVYWGIPLGLILLVVPAVTTALVLGGVATLAQRLAAHGQN